jgi:hypothetical protein
MEDPDWSVDIGREGALYDRRVATGKMSVEKYHAMGGEDAGDVENENLNVIRRRMKKLQRLNAEIAGMGQVFTYFDVWPRETTQQLSSEASWENGGAGGDGKKRKDDDDDED